MSLILRILIGRDDSISKWKWLVSLDIQNFARKKVRVAKLNKNLGIICIVDKRSCVPS